MGSNGIIINLRGLNHVTFNKQLTEATIGGGTLISEAIEAAYANDAQVTTGNGNCVGALGANLGGGFGNLVGINSLGVDNFISLRYVNPRGRLITVTSKDEDLWFALRGAASVIPLFCSPCLCFPILETYDRLCILLNASLGLSVTDNSWTAQISEL